MHLAVRLALVLLPGLSVGWTAVAQAPQQSPLSDSLPPGALQQLGGGQLRLGDAAGFALLSPDGKWAAVLTHLSGVCFLDLSTGRLLYMKKENRPYSEEGLALSTDGRILASLSKPRIIELWDTEKQARLHQLEAQHPPKSVVFSPDGKSLAVGEAAGKTEGAVSVWDVKSGRRMHVLPVAQTLFTRAVFSPDGDIVATWGNVYESPAKGQGPLPSRTIQLWSVATGKELRRIVSDGDRVEAVAFSPDEKKLAVMTWRAGLEIRDTQTGRLQHKLTPQISIGRFVRFSPDGKLLVAVERYGKVQVWETATWKSRRLAGGNDWRVTSVAFPGNQVLACGMAGQSVRVEDLLTLKKASVGEHRFIIQALRFPSSQSVLSADASGRVLLWDREPGKPLAHWELAEDVPQGTDAARQFPRIAVSPKGKYLAAFDFPSQQVYAWDLGTRRKVWSTSGPRHAVETALAFANDHRLAVLNTLLSKDKQKQDTITIWDVEKDQSIKKLILPPPPPNIRRFGAGHLAFSPDGQLLAAAVQHNQLGKVGTEVFIWDLKTGYKKNHMLQNVSQTSVLTFSPDGALLALGGPREGILLVNVWTGKRFRLESIDRGLDAVAFAPDGRTIAGATYYNGDPAATIILWERVTGSIRHKYAGHWGKVHALAYSPDGLALASAGVDTTILVWDLTGKLPFGKGPIPERADLNKLWRELLVVQGREAFPAMGRLIADPATTLAFLKANLRPDKENVLGPADIRKLIASLDSPKFQEREKAMLTLKKLGERALPELNQAMKTDITLEMRLRIEKILEDINEPASHPEDLRSTRAVELLEHLGEDARRHLEELARGSPGAVLTIEARAALARMGPKE
jgi:WD40 repeat protein